MSGIDERNKVGLRKKSIVFFPLFLLFFLIIFFIASHLYSSNDVKEDRLNFLLITIDTLRPDRLSCYSREHLRTPNIDSLAEKGVLFSRAFANTSTTLPSHANILLGTTPLYHGVHENSNFIVREELLTLAEHLKNNGYSTGAFVGAFPLDSRFGLDQGFDIYNDDYPHQNFQKFSFTERKAEVVVENALDWLRSQESAWFLWVHCFDPHDPYEPPEPFKTKYGENPYDGEVAYVDFVMGKFFSFMRENNLFDNTLIVFTGDHGESLGQHGEKTHGFFAYNTTIWIPLIISYPGGKQGEVNQYVSHIDIFPTVCDFLDVEKPAFLHGISLLPATKGKKLVKRPIYFESMYPYYSRGWAPLSGFIYNREKFIESPIPELYDLGKDFSELDNVAAKKELDTYRKQLEKIKIGQTSPEYIKANKRFEREALEKLGSLGYISGSDVSKKESFGPQDDIKVLLPYSYKAMEAVDLYKEGKLKDGFDLLKEVITEKDNIDIAYYNLADLYRKTGKLAEAIEVLKLGLEKIPSNYLIFTSYVNCLSDAEQYDEVIKVISEESFRQMEFDPEIWNILGLAYYNIGDFESARRIYEKAFSLDNESPVLFTNLGDVLYSLAVKTKNQKVFEESVHCFKKAIEISPDYPFPYSSLGKAYKKAGNLDGAIYFFEKALELKPDFDEALFYLGIAYLDKGDKVNALQTFNEYKRRYYNFLPSAAKKKLDSLIQKCEKGP